MPLLVNHGWRFRLPAAGAAACGKFLLAAACCLPAPAVLRAGATTTTTTTTTTTAAREISGVLSLDDCIRLARERNPDILAAAKQLDIAQAGVTTAKAGIYPSLGTNGTYLKRESSFATGLAQDVNRRTEDYTASARLTQNVFSSGRVRAQIDIAKKNVAIQALNYQNTVENVVINLRTQFLQILLAEATVPVRQQALDLLSQQVRDEVGRVSAGTVGQINVSRARVNRANEEPALFQAQDDLRNAYVSLAQTLGVEMRPGETRPPFRIRGSLDSRPTHPKLEECLRRAEAQRPEILARKIELEAAQRQIVVEKSATRPRVDVFAGYDVFSEPSTLATRSYYDGYTIGVQGSWQVFDGLATVGRVRQDRARVLVIGDNLRQARLQAQADVRTAFEGIVQAERTLAALAGNDQAARENLRLITTNVSAGLSSQLDLLQSRLDFTRAQTSRLGALFQYHVSLARLARAMGEAAPAGALTFGAEITIALDPRRSGGAAAPAK